VELRHAGDAAEREDRVLLIMQPLVPRFIVVKDKGVGLDNEMFA
jgi:hypothetical protein